MKYPIYLLLVLMLCCSQSIMWLKALLLTVSMSLVCIKFCMYKPKWAYEKKYKVWFLLFFCSGLVTLLYGAIKGNPGVHYYYLIYLVWPIAFPFIFTQLDCGSLFKIVRLFEVSYVVLLITGFVAFLQMNFGMFAFINIELLGYELSELARPMYLFISPSGPALVEFFILFSFLFSYYCLESDKLTVKKTILLLLGFVNIVISSRRVMMLGFVYIPILLILLTKLANYYKKVYSQRIMLVYALPIVGLFFGIGYIFADIDNISLFFSSAFSSEGDFGSGENVRLDQRTALLNGWYDNFLFGAGTGVNASVVRNDIPGVYELSYYAILFERGLIGGLLYFGLLIVPVVWTIKLVKKCKKRDFSVFLLSYAVCYISLLIANATNPYIGAFDFMWVLFLFIVILNIVEKEILYGKKDMCDYKGV